MLRRPKYAPENMKRALHLVRTEGVSKNKAAKLCGVPRTTLLDKLYGRSPDEPTRTGPKTTLTSAEEDVLVNYICLMADVGYPVSRKEICIEVKNLMDKDGRTTPFKDNLPGVDWYRGFVKRHTQLSERKPQALGKERAIISQDMVDGWFKNCLEYLKGEVNEYEDMLRDPRRVFNADESGFPLCVTSSKVLAPTGAKHVYQVVTNNKTQITVMACMNANGDYMPPLIVYPGQRFRNIGIDSFPGAIYGHSDKGWMDTELFVQFLSEFVNFVKLKHIAFPVILFVDGHSTHVTLDAAQFCHDNDVVLYCLLPNATHILQACDIGLFSPLKTAWYSQVKAWQMNHIGETLTKSIFPGVFKLAWDRVATIQNASQGFKRSSLYPFSHTGIDRSKLGPSKLLQSSQSIIDQSNDTDSPVQQPNLSEGSPIHIETKSISPQQKSPSNIDPYDTDIPVQETSPSNVQSKVPSPGQICPNNVDPLGSTDTDIPVHEISQFNVLHLETEVPNPQRICPNNFEPLESSVTDISIQKPYAKETTESDHNSEIPVLEINLDRSSVVTVENTNPNQDASEIIASSSSAGIPQNKPQNCFQFPPLKSPKSPTYISPAFKSLTLPEMKPKQSRTSIREKLPKLLTGEKALFMLKERADNKEEEERLKNERKFERERKKKEKEIEKKKKILEREEKKKEREENKKKKRVDKILKALESNKRKRSTSSSDDDDNNITYDDSSDDDMGSGGLGNTICYKCEKETLDSLTIVCNACFKVFHRTCTDMDFNDWSEMDIQMFPFECLYC